ncbi:MAG: ABC transporter permease [Solirubrobacteraceae bacterium]
MIGVELAKQSRRPRTLVALAVAGGVPAVLVLVIALSHPSLAERIGNFGSVVPSSGGVAMSLVNLSAMLLFLLPLLVAVFAGESVSGEAASGSLRYLLARPITRRRALAAKAAVAAWHSAACVLLAVLVSLLGGFIAFGIHPLTVIDLQHTSPYIVASAKFDPPAALARLALTSAFVLASLSSTFAFSLLLSTLTARPFSAVAGGLGLGLVSRALDNVPGLHALSPWLPVTDSATSLWTGFFSRPLDAGGVGHALLVQAAYSVAFLTLAFARFERGDLLA